LKKSSELNNENNILKMALNEKDQEIEGLRAKIGNMEQENANNFIQMEKVKRAVHVANVNRIPENNFQNLLFYTKKYKFQHNIYFFNDRMLKLKPIESSSKVVKNFLIGYQF
jgi:hypothetical protein